ncbi:hypothetical protein LX32DRAFT_634386 [Colletotrichum zoysiae]|uniref:Uncharacterized protein n=1 Tax=Colletotrichum zoysiae TaxID=1216348 RepID=A0AAD9M8W6_9PEZI|nr:hypothetical protein LX32DRAFT_634386 [Colletotrichum zoysiae]
MFDILNQVSASGYRSIRRPSPRRVLNILPVRAPPITIRHWGTLQQRSITNADTSTQQATTSFSSWSKGRALKSLSQRCSAQYDDDDDLLLMTWRSAALVSRALLGVPLLGTWQGLRFSVKVSHDATAKKGAKTGATPVWHVEISQSSCRVLDAFLRTYPFAVDS